ncbi:MAG: YraN family protein [Oscillibacter sp.]|nr:YraN family protein [Oscillibacter sp.]
MGNRGEAEAAAYLEGRGYTILARQWRCRFGELDLIALDPSDVVCFVEVKYRGPGTIAAPREFVDGRKQARLRAAAELWLYANAPDASARFDVAEVTQTPSGALRVTYWEDAFS